jgi:hypothetical protein
MTDPRGAEAGRSGSGAGVAAGPTTSSGAPADDTTTQVRPVTSTRAAAARGGQPEDPPTTVLPTGPGPAAPASAGAAPSSRRAPSRTVPPRPIGRTELRPSTGARSGLSVGRSRRARLSLRRIDPWSVFVFTLVASVFVGVAVVVAVAVLFSVLGSLGVISSVNELFAEVTGGLADSGPLLTLRRAVTAAAMLAALNIVFLTLLATLSALLYNLCASFTGGIELTLGEHD